MTNYINNQMGQDQPNQPFLTLVRLTHAIYALQTISFVFGVTYLIAIVALIINYVKLPEARGTWLESHFRWQIRTFWYGLLFSIIGFATLIIAIGWLILLLDYIWLMYRVIKGWFYLYDQKPLADTFL